MIQGRIENWGEAPSVIDGPEPEPQTGEALVRMLATSLNPVDIAIASRRFYGAVPPPPFIPGNELVGEVIESVEHPAGTRVWCHCTAGGFAELAAVPEERMVPVPSGVSDELAVALGVAGIAGWMAVRERADLTLTDEVLVLGASGVVGQVAVKAAASAGNRVIAAGRNARALAGLGAHATVDLTAEDLRQEIAAAAPDGVDVVIDMVWGQAAVAAIGALRHNGRIIQVGNASGPIVEMPAGPFRGGRLDLRGYSIYSERWEDVASAYSEICLMAAAGQIDLPLEIVTLRELPEAWERQVRFATGGKKLVLLPD
ncbi:MAG: zinc-binding alcohol dehydrogenase family protein [Thermoleophilia bacterium]|nr:zinc-binding alcohol dehydrogenase family protein [Thermoleophilia bacterium]MDH3724371.1 zinc-binding alcohol dehydrogenase family protein [Thermoleophilia bacterium]